MGPLLALALATQPAPPQPGGVAPALEPVRLLSDWAWIDRYRADDAARVAGGERLDVVFMGDSITEGWLDKAPGFFIPGRVDRGISAQTTPQMLVRFREDVVALRPRAVHIMAGTNDVAGNTGPISPQETRANIADMTEIAQANGIVVILASIPPAARFPWKPGLETVQAIRSLNAWIRAYAARVGAVYADYDAVLDDGRGGMKPGLSSDEVHPTPQGYAVMAPVAERAIARALAHAPDGGAAAPRP